MEDLVDDLMVEVMMIRRKRMRLEVTVRTKEETIPIISMNRTIEIKEAEVEDKDLEEASLGNVFTAEKKGMDDLNVPNTKEGQIKEHKARLELHM